MFPASVIKTSQHEVHKSPELQDLHPELQGEQELEVAA
jgi:hypothetical protein